MAFIFHYCNRGSVCAHCHYDSAIGRLLILGRKLRFMAIAPGAIGILAGAGKVWAFFIQWRPLLGASAPPIGAIFPADQ